MSFLDSMHTVGSALTAERFRMDTILQNMTNAKTTRTANGEPYRRKQVVFQGRSTASRRWTARARRWRTRACG